MSFTGYLLTEIFSSFVVVSDDLVIYSTAKILQKTDSKKIKQIHIYLFVCRLVGTHRTSKSALIFVNRFPVAIHVAFVRHQFSANIALIFAMFSLQVIFHGFEREEKSNAFGTRKHRCNGGGSLHWIWRFFNLRSTGNKLRRGCQCHTTWLWNRHCLCLSSVIQQK